jgi:O-acetyl-ADP-ribose deacetylase (regulator of RNase III)
MIKLATGNLLEAPAEALVNTVNTVGIMGKGIALQFKQAFPGMFRDYEKACQSGAVELGKMDVHDLGGLVGGPRWIVNFPTKGHWRSKSKLDDVKSGLSDLVKVIETLGIRSIAVPPLGCGHGGLDWEEVRPLIDSAFAVLPDVEVLLFAPVATPAAKAMPNRTERPKMTSGQAALIVLTDRYLKGLLDPFVSLLEIHKLMYFLQAAGQNLRLQFEAKPRGPFATNLRHVLMRMEKHYLVGYGDGNDKPDTQIELLPGAIEEAWRCLEDDEEIGTRMDTVGDLISGFEDSYGMELLSSVHWVMTHDTTAAKDADAAIRAVQRWNPQKKKRLKPDHLAKAWGRLRDHRGTEFAA